MMAQPAAGSADILRTAAPDGLPQESNQRPLRIVLFVNDNYFSYLLARRVLEEHHDLVGKVILSALEQRLPRRIGKIWRQTTPRYFFYRSFVQLLSVVRGQLRRESVQALARRFGVPVVRSGDVGRQVEDLLPPGSFDLGLAFNFDQVLKPAVLQRFHLGVFNVHASKLPADKGISPAVWAFSRGDSDVWATLYQMDAGIDSGPLVRQFVVEIRPGDSAFSLYARICDAGGRELSGFLSEVRRSHSVAVRPQPEAESNYCSWPDVALEQRRRAIGRRLIGLAEAIQLLFLREHRTS